MGERGAALIGRGRSGRAAALAALRTLIGRGAGAAAVAAIRTLIGRGAGAAAVAAILP